MDNRVYCYRMYDVYGRFMRNVGLPDSNYHYWLMSTSGHISYYQTYEQYMQAWIVLNATQRYDSNGTLELGK